MPRQEYPSLRQGLVGAWCPSLGASGLSLIDRSGRNNHGVLTNMGGQQNWVASGTGTALQFDGTNDYVQLGDFARLSVSTEITVSAWVRPLTLAANRLRIVNGIASPSWFNIALKCGTNSPFSDVSFFVAQSATTFAETTTVTGVFAVNQWVHLASTWKAGEASIVFVNGLAVPTVTATTGSTAYQNGTVLLGASTLASLYSNGMQDDTRIYNRALTPAEILLLASRRGIGLTPLPDRAAGLPRKLFVNDAGTWRNGDAYVNNGSGWRLGVPFVNVAGTWR
jgi:hypothetical protein